MNGITTKDSVLNNNILFNHIIPLKNIGIDKINTIPKNWANAHIVFNTISHRLHYFKYISPIIFRWYAGPLPPQRVIISKRWFKISLIGGLCLVYRGAKSSPTILPTGIEPV